MNQASQQPAEGGGLAAVPPIPAVTLVVPVASVDAEVRMVVESIGAQLDRLGHSWEAILVFDGVKGTQWEDALRMQARSGNRVRTIGLHRPFGEAVCLASAFEHARGDVVLTAPEYVQTDPHAIEAMMQALEEGADVVTARRTGRVDLAPNRLQSWAFNAVLRLATGAPFHDLNCSLRAFRRQVLEQLTIYGTLYRYLPVLAFRQGFRVLELPVRHLKEQGVVGIFGPVTYLRRLLDVLGVVFLTRFTHKPLRFFGALGGLSMVAGAGVAATAVVQRALGDDAQLFASPIFQLGVLFFVLGVQIVGFGLVGEIVIYTQARNVREYRVEGVHEE